MIRATVSYEDHFDLEINQAFDLTIKWLNSQHKAKIKKTIPSSFIEAKQGTLMANTGHDPNWKKRIRITFYKLKPNELLIRVEAIPLSRNILRVEKLKQSWYYGLFSHLFSLLHSAESSSKEIDNVQINLKSENKLKYCKNCGNKIDSDAIICPFCGVDII